MSKPAIKLVPILFLAVCAVYYWLANVVDQLPDGGPADFNVYYSAAQAVLTGSTPFVERGFLYPPSFAFLMAPFALTNLLQAQWLWFLCSHAFLLASAWLVWRYCTRFTNRIEVNKGPAFLTHLDHRWIAACVIACIWAFGGAASENLGNLQVGPMIMFLLTIAFTSRGSAQGVAAGASACLKYFPGLLVIVYALERNWRTVAITIASASAGLAVPWIVMNAWLSGPRSPVNSHFWMGTPALLSWSIPSTVLRILDPPTAGTRLPMNWLYGNDLAVVNVPMWQRLTSIGVAGLVIVAGLVALWIVSRGRIQSEQSVWASGAIIAIALAASPICWTHYQLLNYPAVALLMFAAIRRRMWTTLVWAFVCLALVYQVPVQSLRLYHDSHGDWTATSPLTLYFWTSIAPLANLALAAAFFRMMRAEPPDRFARPDAIANTKAA